MNRVVLIGRLGADPESRDITGGIVVNLRVATSERKKVGDVWEEYAEWHRVVCFGRTAENVARYLKKGREVAIEGRLKTNKWQDKAGNDRWTTEIVAGIVEFIGGRPDDADGGGSSSRRDRSHGRKKRSAASRSERAIEADAEPDSDIPF